MKKQVFLVLFLAVAMIAGCSKSDTNDNQVIELKVKAIYAPNTAKALFNISITEQKTITGITVTLYKTAEDLQKGTNKVASGVTDEKGEVLLKNLEEREYYIQALNDHCLGNVEEIAKNQNKVTLKKGLVATYEITNVDQMSAVDINNKLNKSIYISIDTDSEKVLLEKGKSVEIVVIPTGGSTSSNYLSHQISLYNSVDDTQPYDYKRFSVNANCQTFVLDLQ